MTDQPLVTIEAHDSYVLCLVFTREGSTLVSGGFDNLIKLWRVQDWSHMTTYAGHANSVNGIALTPDEKMLASCSTDQSVRLWSFPDGKLLHELRDRKKTAAGLTISADGSRVAAAYYGGRAVVWDMNGSLVTAIKASPKNITSVAFSPDGKLLATAGLGEEIHLWYLPSGAHAGKLTGHEIAVGSLRFIEQGRVLASLGYRGVIKLWETKNWEQALEVRPEGEDIRGLGFSPDHKLAYVTMAGKVQLWSVSDWQMIREFPVGTRVVSSGAVSYDGRLFAVGAADRKIRVWTL